MREPELGDVAAPRAEVLETPIQEPALGALQAALPSRKTLEAPTMAAKSAPPDANIEIMAGMGAGPGQEETGPPLPAGISSTSAEGVSLLAADNKTLQGRVRGGPAGRYVVSARIHREHREIRTLDPGAIEVRRKVIRNLRREAGGLAPDDGGTGGAPEGVGGARRRFQGVRVPG